MHAVQMRRELRATYRRSRSNVTSICEAYMTKVCVEVFTMGWLLS